MNLLLLCYEYATAILNFTPAGTHISDHFFVTSNEFVHRFFFTSLVSFKSFVYIFVTSIFHFLFNNNKKNTTKCPFCFRNFRILARLYWHGWWFSVAIRHSNSMEFRQHWHIAQMQPINDSIRIEILAKHIR